MSLSFKSSVNFFKELSLKLIRINDSPQKVSLGFGLGVFLGILPGSGPIAALALASLLRINRASAIIGSLLTNTWLSAVTFALSLKLGCAILKVSRQDIYHNWLLFIGNFSWSGLFKLSVLKVIFPVFLGYAIVASVLGLLFYLIAIIILKRLRKDENTPGTDLSR